jgi:hypothetical protein
MVCGWCPRESRSWGGQRHLDRSPRWIAPFQGFQCRCDVPCYIATADPRWSALNTARHGAGGGIAAGAPTKTDLDALERSGRKSPTAGSIPAASTQSYPPLSSALLLKRRAGLAFRDQIRSLGNRGGREARCCSGSSAPTARVRFRSPSRRVSPAARFLLASHRTGRADFPHPALGQISHGAFSAGGFAVPAPRGCGVPRRN